ncbi:MAG: hypothetical protein HYZ39_09050 [Mycolicibacterium cosmeticum]|nr:hypothetical protein [Mycolicibacterium cosmeticum]
MDDGGEGSVFRDRWRERQSAAGRPGELIKQPGWIDSGLWTLGLLIAAGVLAASTGTVARTAALPAVAHGVTVSATRTADVVPIVGDPAQFHDASGATRAADILEVTATEVRAALRSPGPTESPGVLDVPSGRQRLIGVLFSRWW